MAITYRAYIFFPPIATDIVLWLPPCPPTDCRMEKYNNGNLIALITEMTREKRKREEGVNVTTMDHFSLFCNLGDLWFFSSRKTVLSYFLTLPYRRNPYRMFCFFCVFTLHYSLSCVILKELPDGWVSHILERVLHEAISITGTQRVRGGIFLFGVSVCRVWRCAD